jgi:nicotinate-nucleotide pyrophosphorylase (carboxylating)
MTSRATTSRDTATNREERVHTAFYRGEHLTLGNHDYVQALSGLANELLRQDTEAGDLTVDALGVGGQQCSVEVRAKEAGIAAGLSEAHWIYERAGLGASCLVRDGNSIHAGDILLRIEGNAGTLLALERLAVNLLQRMSGVATATRHLVDAARCQSPNAHVVATRKTPWGLLDKRAVHIGGGGTHRLSLSDAILIKTNHLRLAAVSEAMSIEGAVRRAWEHREGAAFVEVEVTTAEEAMLAARAFRDLQERDTACPCILMLDNFSPVQASATVGTLRSHDLHDAVLIEASGNVGDSSLAAYAASGVDAISIGALTHSARALDLSAKLIPGLR